MSSQDAAARLRGLSLPLVLGSSSKYRAQILRDHGISFSVQVPDIDEKAITTHPDDRAQSDPAALVLKIAHAKADRLLVQETTAKSPPAQQTDSHPSSDAVQNPPHLLVCCDQVTVFDGQIREKPVDREECRRYLRSYSTTKPAETYSSVVVVNTATKQRAEGVDIAKQYFHPVPDAVIEQLIEKGDVMYCCGGFLIDDDLIVPYLAERVGETDSIIGLPLQLLASLVAKVC
ncbi:inosine triphosphate pyrophosphatase-like protein [Polychytrium aggregatum]|uniref:inosine triphosphate pyrophosphatase-like protein n=1 Tax=Polychytrium aggregatum TaxID=110093 RepID=UPI0022FE33B5|nr:inosine triphosphate pyrophosphatase-like protein [Polychytrium aggregatum]KAI9199392.1 inosine triphosphate pyrophosphatase-like protein [Polychytrium aggregatum]